MQGLGPKAAPAFLAFAGSASAAHPFARAISVIPTPAWPDSLRKSRRCTGEILRDDGRELSREFVVTGSLEKGQPLPQVCMKAGEFKGMGWVNRHWGMSANIAAGQASQDRLREAIQHLSKGVRQRHIFTHSGWRKINGVWAFFHGGGAINGS